MTEPERNSRMISFDKKTTSFEVVFLSVLFTVVVESAA